MANPSTGGATASSGAPPAVAASAEPAAVSPPAAAPAAAAPREPAARGPPEAQLGLGRKLTGTGGTSGAPAVQQAPEAPPSGEPPSLTGIVAAQNAVRAAHGVGPLVWDADLATVAQAWAETCTDIDGAHRPRRSQRGPYRELRRARRRGYVRRREHLRFVGARATGPAAVTSWANEESHYHYDTNTCDAGQQCGHYTQIVWATTTKVGCGYHKCTGLTYSGTIVCDYAPGGNISGQKPY